MTSSMTSSPDFFFCLIRDDLLMSEVRLKLCLLLKKNQNGRHFELARNFFLPKAIPEVENARKIAMGISDILSF